MIELNNKEKLIIIELALNIVEAVEYSCNALIDATCFYLLNREISQKERIKLINKEFQVNFTWFELIAIEVKISEEVFLKFNFKPDWNLTEVKYKDTIRLKNAAIVLDRFFPEYENEILYNFYLSQYNKSELPKGKESRLRLFEDETINFCSTTDELQMRIKLLNQLKTLYK